MELKDVFGNVLFALESAKTIAELVTAAIAANKSLYRASLDGASLYISCGFLETQGRISIRPSRINTTRLPDL